MPATKSKSPARVGGQAVALGAEPKTTVVFGITFNLRGTPIPVTAADLTEAKKNGVKLALPGPVELGSFEDFQEWFKKQFGVEIPSASSLPSPLDKVLGKLAKLVVTVEDARIRVPGEAEKEAHTEYKILLSGQWPKSEGGIPLIPGVLEIEGGMFGVTNEVAKTP